MAHDYTGLFRDLAEHPLTIEKSFRARLAVQGRAVPLRDYETAALTLPKGFGSIERVDVSDDGIVRAFSSTTMCAFKRPGCPPIVLPHNTEPPSLLETTKDAWTNGDLVAGVRIVRDGQGERVNLPGHSTFAEIQRDTVRVVGGKLRYVGWEKSYRGHFRRIRETPSLVVGGVATPIECGEFPNVLADGDDLYVLTLETTQVRKPTPGGTLSGGGGDGKRRETRVRSLDGSVDAVEMGSVPDDWNFVAKTGRALILTGSRSIDRGKACPLAAVLRADGKGFLADHEIIGNGHRLPNGALVECVLKDRSPGFAWFHDDATGMLDCKKLPLYGNLKDIDQADERTLNGWHVEGDTLFLSRYSRD